ncbi:hypothetical protein LguiB_011056 [Lonicera macranthoides]
MAVASASTEKINEQQSMVDQSTPSSRSALSVSDAASQSSSTGDPSDHYSSDHATNSSPNSSPNLQIQHQPSLRSEEYRQLFHLPPEEVLIQDFNCALQENFLLQGHMYLFVHHICFYSNLFGFENKKMIHFQEITSVRRAKTAAIFPTAIEIIAAEKKYFFTSFLSRDEAFKLIFDGWMQHGNGAKAIPDQQESRIELNSQETGSGIVIVDEAKNSKQPVDELDFTERNKVVSVSEDPEPLANGKAEIVVTSSAVQDNLEENSEVVQVTDCSSSRTSLEWKVEDSDAPEVPGCYTMVAESKFQIKVEEFFNLFFSDDAIRFCELCHKKCGDKDFKCSSWYKHDEFGHARDVSFQHPIKLYFGARFGCCKEIQKYQVYRNSHLVVHTSQEISDVPYADYFRVEGLWDVKNESEKSCKLRVYINVAFSKYTMFKGKIMQSTVEECKEAYAIWIDLTHKLLRQKHLEKEEGIQAANLIANTQDPPKGQSEPAEHSEKSNEETDLGILETLSDSKDINQVSVPSERSLSGAALVTSFFRNSVGKFYLPSRSQSQLPSLAVIVIAVIFLLMQITIIMLLAKPQQIQVISQADYYRGSTAHGGGATAETAALLDMQISHLKEELVIVETLLEKMKHEHLQLRDKLKDLTLFRKKHIS